VSDGRPRVGHLLPLPPTRKSTTSPSEQISPGSRSGCSRSLPLAHTAKGNGLAAIAAFGRSVAERSQQASSTGEPPVGRVRLVRRSKKQLASCARLQPLAVFVGRSTRDAQWLVTRAATLGMLIRTECFVVGSLPLPRSQSQGFESVRAWRCWVRVNAHVRSAMRQIVTPCWLIPVRRFRVVNLYSERQPFGAARWESVCSCADCLVEPTTKSGPASKRVVRQISWSVGLQRRWVTWRGTKQSC
jgi:hypothetical protein